MDKLLKVLGILLLIMVSVGSTNNMLGMTEYQWSPLGAAFILGALVIWLSYKI